MATDPEAPMVPNSDGDPISYLQAPLIHSMNEDVVPRSETFKACAANFVKVRRTGDVTVTLTTPLLRITLPKLTRQTSIVACGYLQHMSATSSRL